MTWEMPGQPPHPSPEDIEKFKAIWRRKSGTDIGDAEALILATRLLQLSWLVFNTPKEAVERIRREMEAEQERRDPPAHG